MSNDDTVYDADTDADPDNDTPVDTDEFEVDKDCDDGTDDHGDGKFIVETSSACDAIDRVTDQ